VVARRIVVCLDVAGGRVVKGTKFESLRSMGDPVTLARKYERSGADEIVVLQIDGFRGRPISARLVRTLAEGLAIPLTVGGGVSGVAQAETLLAAGADRVSLNSAALQDPGILGRLAKRFGRQAVVLAIDVRAERDGYRVYARGGSTATGRDAVEWAREGARRGAGELLVTSIDRDGTKSGYDLRLLRRLRAAVPIPLIASGGARDAASVLSAFRSGGADAALAAGIFHEGRTTPARVKQYLARHGLEVRS
jgi:cyclase